MPFPFTHIYDLLEPLSALSFKSPPPAPSVLRTQQIALITSWFAHHRDLLVSTSADPVALFSVFFPELRRDRVYNLREDGLVKVIGRCLGLGSTRIKDLADWRRGGDGDLGAVVGRVMAQAENGVPAIGSGEEVMIEEVEEVLERLGGRSLWSEKRERGNELERTRGRAMAHEILGPVYLRLSSRDGKWFTRTILKSYLPMVIPEQLTFYSYHFLLPHLFAFQNDLRKALGLLNTPLFKLFPYQPPKQDIGMLLEGAVRLLQPEVGVRIKRPTFLKARSSRDAVSLARGMRMSLERKYDGEYCQVHIDLSKPSGEWIRIFSKSGRDSTEDREGVHSVILKAIKAERPQERGFKRKCILEGELLVYCEREKRILEFYHLRNHVNRAGFFLGNRADERPDYENQHLMIIFYDLLLVDDTPYFAYSYDRRITTLTDIVHPIPGAAELASRQEINFSAPNALQTLRQAFAEGITKRYEGFVLKPCERPYLGFGLAGTSWIKLKKDYIQGLGDTGDFAIVGGGYEAERGRERNLDGNSLTTFHVGCLENKEAAVRFGAKPVFRIMFYVSYNILKSDLKHLNRLAYFRSKPYDQKTAVIDEYHLIHTPGYTLPPMDVYFTNPLVFEIMGGGFDRPGNTDFYILRWPRVVKIHWDREWRDALGFQELQDLAEEAIREPENGGMEEERGWLERLVEKDERVGVRKAGGRAGKRKSGEWVMEKLEKKKKVSLPSTSEMELCTQLPLMFKSRGKEKAKPPSQHIQQQEQQLHLSTSSSFSISSLSTLSPTIDPTSSLSPRERKRQRGNTSPPSSPPPRCPTEALLSSPTRQLLDQHQENYPQETTEYHLSQPHSQSQSQSQSQSRHNHQRTPLSALPDPHLSISNSKSSQIKRQLQSSITPTPTRPSPLHNSTVYLAPSVLAIPDIHKLLLEHKVKAVFEWKELLPASSSSPSFLSESSPPSSSIDVEEDGNRNVNDNFPKEKSGIQPTPKAEKTILLIDSRTPRAAKAIIEKLVASHRHHHHHSHRSQRAEKQDVEMEVYCWRVLMHSDWRGEVRRDGGGSGEGGREGKKKKIDWDLFRMVGVRV